jgi:hypothetical protein
VILSRNNLKKIIESYLKENDNWLGDDPEDFGVNLDDLKPVNYKQIYEKYLKIFKDEKSKIQKDILSDISGQIPEKSKNSLSKTLNRINLVLVKKIGEGDPGTIAAAFSIIHTEHGMYEPKIEDIKDEDIVYGKNYFDAYKLDKFKNPIILLIPSIFSKKIKEFSEEEERRLIAHEIDHIKYAIMQTRIKNLNEEQVKNILRTDLIGKNRQEIANVFIKEGYFNESETAYKKVSPMFKHYIELFKNEKVNEKVHIEEFAVRINVLDNHPDKEPILDAYNKNDIDYFEAAEYDEQIAQILPFLVKNITQNELDKVVKSKKNVSSNIA